LAEANWIVAVRFVQIPLNYWKISIITQKW
jgi:hypothetical protein